MPAPLELLLADVQAKKPGAENVLADAVHEELRAMARRHLSRSFGARMGGITIQPTMLADDTLMKMLQQRQAVDGAGHFFALASSLMMRVLIDYHRARKASKRGGGAVKVSISPDIDAAAPDSASDVDVEALNGAMDRLAQLDQRKADVVRYRILWGFSVAETAAALGIGVATVERDWVFAKTWLAKELASCQD